MNQLTAHMHNLKTYSMRVRKTQGDAHTHTYMHSISSGPELKHFCYVATFVEKHTL